MTKTQNKNDNSETLQKVPITDIIRSRLQELQKKYNCNGKQMARIMEIPYDAYRGIIRVGGTKYLKRERIQKLSQYFKCTQDYITGDSQYPHLDKDGREITHPISFSDDKYAHTKLLEKVTTYLSDNHVFLRNLYLLLYELSPDTSQTLITSINTIIELIRINSLMMRRDNLTEENLDLIYECLKCDSQQLTSATIALANADKAFDNKDFKAALSGYLQIIYHTSIDAKPVVEKAVQKVQALHLEMQDFPLNLLELIWEFKNLEEINYEKNTDKANNIIIEYMRQNDIPLIDRNSYFDFDNPTKTYVTSE